MGATTVHEMYQQHTNQYILQYKGNKESVTYGCSTYFIPNCIWQCCADHTTHIHVSDFLIRSRDALTREHLDKSLIYFTILTEHLIASEINVSH